MSRRKWGPKDDETVGAQIRIGQRLRIERTTADRTLIANLRKGDRPLTESLAIARILELLVDADLRSQR